MTNYLDDEANTCHSDLRADVRKALSPVLGGRPYVIYVDCTSLDDMKNDTVDIHLITPGISVACHHARRDRVRHGYSEKHLHRRLTWEN